MHDTTSKKPRWENNMEQEATNLRKQKDMKN
jgi:hypothetical protein